MSSNQEVKLTSKFIVFLLCIMFIIPSSLYAGINITTKSGILSKLNEKDGATTYVYIDIVPPKSGKQYV